MQIYSILAWGDEHFARTGRWPTQYSGDVRAAPWETWRAIDNAMRSGCRGCRGGDSLALLFHRYRGRPLPLPRPRQRLNVRKILGWADAYHRRTGQWPCQNTRGPVAEGLNDTWSAIEAALSGGLRGLAGGDSIAKILLRYRGVRRARNRPHFTLKQILACADRYHARYGRWPTPQSGPVAGAPGDTWMAIEKALRLPCRGLPSGYTLATLLEKRRGARNKSNLPPYTVPQILGWADAHHRRCGRWPTLHSGPIPGARGETWLKVEGALSKGRQGCRVRDSLSQLLVRHGRRPRRNLVHHPARHEHLTIEQILGWADQFHQRHGRWPATKSGPIPGRRDETWQSVDNAPRRARCVGCPNARRSRYCWRRSAGAAQAPPAALYGGQDPDLGRSSLSSCRAVAKLHLGPNC